MIIKFALATKGVTKSRHSSLTEGVLEICSELLCEIYDLCTTPDVDPLSIILLQEKMRLTRDHLISTTRKNPQVTGK